MNQRPLPGFQASRGSAPREPELLLTPRNPCSETRSPHSALDQMCLLQGPPVPPTARPLWLPAPGGHLRHAWVPVLLEWVSLALAAKERRGAQRQEAGRLRGTASAALAGTRGPGPQESRGSQRHGAA